MWPAPLEDLRLAITHMCGRSADGAWSSGGDPWYAPVPLDGPPVPPPVRVSVITDPAARAHTRMCVAVNLLGLPAVTVPVGFDGGLPQAVQIIGPRFCEDLCLDAAAAIEKGTGPLTPIDPRPHPQPLVK